MKNIQMEKLFGGRKTAEEVHGELAFPPGAKCAGCTVKPMIRCIVLAPFDEAAKRMPEIAEADPEWLMKRIVQIRENPTDEQGKPYVRISTTYACKACRPMLEREAAKAPSWCIVEFNTVKPDRFISGRAGSSHVD